MRQKTKNHIKYNKTLIYFLKNSFYFLKQKQMKKRGNISLSKKAKLVSASVLAVLTFSLVLATAIQTENLKTQVDNPPPPPEGQMPPPPDGNMPPPPDGNMPPPPNGNMPPPPDGQMPPPNGQPYPNGTQPNGQPYPNGQQPYQPYPGQQYPMDQQGVPPGCYKTPDGQVHCDQQSGTQPGQQYPNGTQPNGQPYPNGTQPYQPYPGQQYPNGTQPQPYPGQQYPNGTQPGQQYPDQKYPDAGTDWMYMDQEECSANGGTWCGNVTDAPCFPPNMSCEQAMNNTMNPQYGAPTQPGMPGQPGMNPPMTNDPWGNYNFNNGKEGQQWQGPNFEQGNFDQNGPKISEDPRAQKDIERMKKEVERENANDLKTWKRMLEKMAKQLGSDNSAIAAFQTKLTDFEAVVNTVKSCYDQMEYMSQMQECQGGRDELNWSRQDMWQSFQSFEMLANMSREKENFVRECKNIEKETGRAVKEGADAEAAKKIVETCTAFVTSIEEAFNSGDGDTVRTAFDDARWEMGDMWEQVKNLHESVKDVRMGKDISRWVKDLKSGIAEGEGIISDLQAKGKNTDALIKILDKAKRLSNEAEKCIAVEDFGCAEEAMRSAGFIKENFERALMQISGGAGMGYPMKNQEGMYNEQIQDKFGYMFEEGDSGESSRAVSFEQFEQQLNAMFEAKMAQMLQQVEQMTQSVVSSLVETVATITNQQVKSALEQKHTNLMENVLAVGDTGKVDEIGKRMSEMAQKIAELESANEELASENKKLKTQFDGATTELAKLNPINDEMASKIEAKRVEIEACVAKEDINCLTTAKSAIIKLKNEEQKYAVEEGLTDFGDVKIDDWYYKSANAMSQLGMIKGKEIENDYTDKSFAPGDPAALAEVITTIVRDKYGKDQTGEPTNPENAPAWAKGNIRTCEDNGWTNCNSQTNYFNAATRGQLAQLLVSAYGMQDVAGDLSVDDVKEIFSDCANEADLPYCQAIGALNFYGIITGQDTDNGVKADIYGIVNRAQLAAVLDRMEAANLLEERGVNPLPTP